MAVASPSRPRDLWLKALAGSQERRARAAKVAQDRALAAALPRMARRVSKAFLALSASAVHGPAVKEITYPLTYSEPEWDAFTREMRQILTQEYINLGDLAMGAVEGQLGVTLAFDLNERIIRAADIGNRVKGITDESKGWLRSTIRQGIDDGVHPSVIAKRMREQMEGWAGLSDLSKSRAYTIARTETANAYNLGAIEGYRASGIVRQVRCIDAPSCGWTYHNDPDTANGKIVTLDEAAAQPISHPNCVRAFAAVAAGLEQDTGKPTSDWREFTDLPASTFGEILADEDEALKEIIRRRGVLGNLPTLATRAEIDAAILRGEIEFFRGGKGEWAENFRTGGYYAGKGIWGNGTYLATGAERSLGTLPDFLGEAESYSARRIAEDYAKGGQVVRGTIKPGGRVIDWGDLEDRWIDAIEEWTSDRDRVQRATAQRSSTGERVLSQRARLTRQGDLPAVLQDPGRFAAAQGYDAIRVPVSDRTGPVEFGDQWVILDRSMMRVQRD